MIRVQLAYHKADALASRAVCQTGRGGGELIAAWGNEWAEKQTAGRSPPFDTFEEAAFGRPRYGLTVTSTCAVVQQHCLELPSPGEIDESLVTTNSRYWPGWLKVTVVIASPPAISSKG